MKLFDVDNFSSGTAAYVIAEDENEVAELSKQCNPTRRARKLRITDITQETLGSENGPSLQALLASGRRGVICLEIPNVTFEQILAGPQLVDDEGGWAFMEDTELGASVLDTMKHPQDWS